MARPLVRPSPRSAMFFPLVMLVAVLPGLYALRNWDLTPPGPWWGLRGLAVLEGRLLDQLGALPSMGPPSEARMFQAVALQPPLYAWLEAAALFLSGDQAPLATVLPSYAAGVLVVMLVYWHGRLWRGAGLGLTAAVLTGFNRDLLVQMQQATPSTLGLAGLLATLLAYGYHLRNDDGRRIGWIMLGGLALGLSLLTIGGFALLAVPVILLHLGAIAPAPTTRRAALGRWWRPWRDTPNLVAVAVILMIGLAMAAPWHVMMARRHGELFLNNLLAAPQTFGTSYQGLMVRLLDLAPATLPLGLFAAVRAVRRALVAEEDDPATVGGAFWVVWLAVGALAPAALPHGPRPALNLFLLVPLNLLAAQAITDLAGRRIPARAVVWLAPATACSMTWWFSSELRHAVETLAQGHRPSSTTALGLHLGLDLILALAIATRGLDRWARRRDDRRRLVLGAFLGAVVAVTVASGLREVGFRHRETSDLLALREAVLRRHQEHPFTLLAVVGPPTGGPWATDHHHQGRAHRPTGPLPGGRLRFVLRATLPHLAQLDLARADELLSLPDGRRLVILAGASERLPYAVQSRLGLEAIHPGRAGVLDAFASGDRDRPPANMARSGRDGLDRPR
ncbi:MAG: hypothetical protein ABI353_08985 [Isosphaeraceae bacterium]